MNPEYGDIGHPSIRFIEEASEVIKIVAKAERFGWDNYHPDLDKSQTNYIRFLNEWLDLHIAFTNLLEYIREIREK